MLDDVYNSLIGRDAISIRAMADELGVTECGVVHADREWQCLAVFDVDWNEPACKSVVSLTIRRPDLGG